MQMWLFNDGHFLLGFFYIYISKCYEILFTVDVILHMLMSSCLYLFQIVSQNKNTFYLFSWRHALRTYIKVFIEVFKKPLENGFGNTLLRYISYIL